MSSCRGARLLPLEKITPGDTDFSRGPGAQTIAVDDIPSFSPLICYEAIFPWTAVQPGARPKFLLNLTNDAWYGRSPGPYQHFAMARMRAVEQGLPLVRAANNGISAVVDPYGRIVRMLPLDARGVMDEALPEPLPPTFYARYGERVTLIVLLAAWCLAWVSLQVRKM
ncbi:MAG: apolipoprotein N-acyltransferase [Alphaproteobacteria bacterium]